MDCLLNQIRERHGEAADVLIETGFETDSDIRSLTKEDLKELFPRVQDLKMRKKILAMIDFNPFKRPLNILKTPSQTQPQSKDGRGHRVTVKIVVGGITFGAHKQLMDRVKGGSKDVEVVENSQDSDINIVFCPIISRAETDVEAAMSGITDDKPVILVKMFHVVKPSMPPPGNTVINDRNIVL